MFSSLNLDDLPPILILPVGAVVFVMILAIHALVGVVYAAVFPETDIMIAAGISVTIGLLFSTFVLFEIVIGKFFVAKKKGKPKFFYWLASPSFGFQLLEYF